MEEQKALDADWDGFGADEETIVQSDPITKIARDTFGIRYLFPWQRIVIANILDAASACADGSDEEALGRQIVLLPTGAGKSLCFLTPALVLKGPTLVIYPLLALMSDQERRMASGGLKSVTFRGGQSAFEREENFRKIREGAQIILANPEVLQDDSLVLLLSKCNIAHVAIDEAHCVAEWGDTFRPAYLTLGNIIKRLNVPVATAFTATASPTVLSRVQEVLFAGEAHLIRGDSDRPNIHYNVIRSYAKTRDAFKLSLLKEKPLLIFCGTRSRSESMARELAVYYGYDKVRFYHAGLEKAEKTAVEKWFYDKKDAILCCTCAYGMGVDKQDIRTVIHLEPPSSAEAYLQESGRAARDGGIGNAYLLWSSADEKRFSKANAASRERAIFDFATASTCRRQILLEALGGGTDASGEKVFCSGCDVCKRGGPCAESADGRFVLDFVKRYRRFFRNDELLHRITVELNERDKPLFGRAVWDVTAVSEIVEAMYKDGLLKVCLWPYSKRIDYVKSRRKINKMRTYRVWSRVYGIRRFLTR